MDNQENKKTDAPVEGLPVKAAKEKKTPKKPKVEEFMAGWRGTLSSSKDPLAKIRQMIKTGFEGEISGETLSQIASTLLEAQAHVGLAERLALSLAVQERFGKLKPLAQRVLSALRTHFGKAIDYDAQEFVGYRSPKAIGEWVSEHAPKAPAADRDAWLRRFVTCLLKDSDAKTLLTGLIAATRNCAPRKGRATNQEVTLVRGVVAALIPPVVGTNRLQLMMAGVNSLEDQFQEMLSREATLERQIHTKQTSIDDLEDKLTVLEGSVAETRKDSAQKANKIAELEKSIQDASDRHALLDQHWRGVSEQQLAKQSGSFREKVQHELQEALLALDREQPNIEMALQRLRRIREILEK